MRAVAFVLLAATMAITLDLSSLHGAINERFYPLLSNHYRHLHLYGGAGSSKSHFAAQKDFLRILCGYETGVKHYIVALRKTSPAARRSLARLHKHYVEQFQLTPDVVDVLDDGMQLKFSNGSELVCGGLDDPSKLKSIENVTAFRLEEANEFDAEDLKQVDIRLRPDFKSYAQITYLYNPSDFEHELYTIYRDLPVDYTGVAQWRGREIYVHHSTYKDNRFISPEYAAVLEGYKAEDEGYYQVYTQGRWGARRALIYAGAYTVAAKGAWPQSFGDGFYGLDFGYNDPTALVHVGVYDGRPYAEQIIYESHLNNDQLIAKMKALGVSQRQTIWADSAEPARISAIQGAGFDCRGATDAKKQNAVKARIDVVRMAKPVIHPDSTDIIRELHAYAWKVERDTGRPIDEPVKINDHSMNAIEYAIYQQLRQFSRTAKAERIAI
jgi:phage terminase large subunit